MISKGHHEQMIKESILDNKVFNITVVNNYEHIKSSFYKHEEYPLIAQLVKEKKWEEIEGVDIHATGFREYLDIIKFTDQNGNLYVTTVYDSDELMEDPHVIEIFPLT